MVYPREIAGIIDVVNFGPRHTLAPDIERVYTEVEGLRVSWERNLAFTLLSYDEARKNDPMVDSWIALAQNPALGAHTLILADCPVPPKESGPHAETGSDVLEGMCAQGCTTIDSGISGSPWSPFPSDNEDEEMTYDQTRLTRRFRKGRRPDAVSGSRSTATALVPK
jgi:hypothetical protein